MPSDGCFGPQFTWTRLPRPEEDDDGRSTDPRDEYNPEDDWDRADRDRD